MHKGTAIREAFQNWLDGCGDAEDASAGKAGDPAPIPQRFVKGLWHCTDVLPAGYCQMLDIPPGSNYARAVQALAAEKADRQRRGR